MIFRDILPISTLSDPVIHHSLSYRSDALPARRQGHLLTYGRTIDCDYGSRYTATSHYAGCSKTTRRDGGMNKLTTSQSSFSSPFARFRSRSLDTFPSLSALPSFPLLSRLLCPLDSVQTTDSRQDYANAHRHCTLVFFLVPLPDPPTSGLRESMRKGETTTVLSIIRLGVSPRRSWVSVECVHWLIGYTRELSHFIRFRTLAKWFRSIIVTQQY